MIARVAIQQVHDDALCQRLLAERDAFEGNGWSHGDRVHLGAAKEGGEKYSAAHDDRTPGSHKTWWHGEFCRRCLSFRQAILPTVGGYFATLWRELAGAFIACKRKCDHRFACTRYARLVQVARDSTLTPPVVLVPPK